MQLHHGRYTLRGIVPLPSSPFSDRKGRRGRLFPNLPSLEIDKSHLLTLANSMKETEDNPSGDSPTIPAGFTFLGQFIDHDMTFDSTSSSEQQNDPEASQNFRTPLLELDAVYGGGPENEPFLYDQDDKWGGCFLIGNNHGNLQDLPRNKQGVALIGDPRNDENGILSQLHLAFLQFHNAVYKLVNAGKIRDLRYFTDPFQETQRLVRWHYQWIIVHEFLPLIIDHKVLAEVWMNGFKCYYGNLEPFPPVEFAVAAYRYGYSQIRSMYTINARKPNIKFIKQEVRGMGIPSFEPIPPDFVVDWRYFFGINGSKPQASRLIDTRIAAEVFDLPFSSPSEQQSLSLCTLLQGQSCGLPSGEMVACFLGIEPLSPDQTGIAKYKLEQTPLWFYILKEAELNKEDKLGPVGGRIVAEVFMGILKGDSQSYLSVAPHWEPCLPSIKKRDFTIADLIKLAQSISEKSDAH